MKYTLGKDWKRSIYKTLKAGQTLDITPELGQWLNDNGYGEKKIKKTKKVKEDGNDNKSGD